MKLVFVSSEVSPYSRTGGLGIVVGELAAALARAGHTVVTVSPRYGSVDASGAEDTGVSVGVAGAGTSHEVRYLHQRDADGTHHLLVTHSMFDRPGLYGDEHGAFGDNHLRFAVLCRAAIEAARHVPLGGAPLGEDVVFHAHDWQAALVPVLLQAVYRPLGLFERTPSVLTIHNLMHQGRFAARLFDELDLPARWFAPWALEYYSALNLLKGGLLFADRITTVSPTYAGEITTAVGGFGLERVLRHRHDGLSGILNGIDADAWDPGTDPHLAAPFGPEDLEGKQHCKAGLQASLGLPADPRTPIVGSVGRLDPQKGVDLLVESIPWLVESEGAQVVVLGSAVPAHRGYEDALRHLEHRFPHQVRAWIGYSDEVSHQIFAGADLYAMPSLFEPCGLSQMYAQRYGTPPVVRSTGGLADSVDPADDEGTQGTGWTFHLPDGHHFRDALWRGLDTWRHRPAAFRGIQARGMARDFSWDGRVPEYEAVYEAAKGSR